MDAKIVEEREEEGELGVEQLQPMRAGEMVACHRCGTMIPRSWLLSTSLKIICQDCYDESTD